MAYRTRFDQDEGDLITGSRVCRICDQRKPMTSFYWTGNRQHRIRVCSDCNVARARERREQNREHTARRSFLANLRVSYGMTEDDYQKLLAEQSGCCAVCRREFGDRAPQVDHDHATGVVRGILCFTCNTGIGKMRDDPGLLRAAAAYLEQDPPTITGRPRRLTREEARAARSAAARKSHTTAEGQAKLRNRPRGERNPAARLDDEAARHIVARYRAGGVTQAELAAEYGCSPSLIGLITRGKIRRELTHGTNQQNATREQVAEGASDV